MCLDLLVDARTLAGLFDLLRNAVHLGLQRLHAGIQIRFLKRHRSGIERFHRGQLIQLEHRRLRYGR
ncbi:hypothetical protein D3C76_950690 [compost metagenome]